MTWLGIISLGLVVFFNRYVFLVPSLPLRLSHRLRRFLSYALPGVLPAICGPMIWLDKGHLRLGVFNPYLWAALFAVGLSLARCRPLLVVALSMAAFWGLRALMPFPGG